MLMIRILRYFEDCGDCGGGGAEKRPSTEKLDARASRLRPNPAATTTVGGFLQSGVGTGELPGGNI